MRNDDDKVKLGQLKDIPLDERPMRRPPATDMDAGPALAGPVWMKWGAAALLVVIVILAWMLIALRSSQQVLIDRMDKQFSSLGDRLEVTDQTLSQSAEKDADMLKAHDEEIRKLWDVSFKRNKSNIEANKSAIDTLKADLKQAQLQTAQQSADSKEALLKEIRALGTQLAQLDTRLVVVVDVQKQLQTQVAENGRRVAKLERESGAALQADVDKLASELGGLRTRLEPRLKAAEEAIAAIDAHRRQVNQQIADIEARLGP